MPDTQTTTRYPVMTLAQFHEVARSGGNPGDVEIVKYGAIAPVERAEGADGSRVRRFAITSERVDRESDTIALDGWDLSEYQRNPVVLWAHDYRSLPVARSSRISTEQRGDLRLMMSDDEFPAAGVYDFADTVLALVDGGFLNATSVGFRPLRWAFNEERFGVDFLEQEMLEHSIVPIPANPDALIAARSAGISLDPIRLWAERTLDEVNGEAGLWIPRSKVGDAMRVLSNKTVVAALTRDLDDGTDATDAASATEGGDEAGEETPPTNEETNDAEGGDDTTPEATEDENTGDGEAEAESSEEQEGDEPENEDEVDIDPEELRALIGEVAREATRTFVASASGRLD